MHYKVHYNALKYNYNALYLRKARHDYQPKVILNKFSITKASLEAVIIIQSDGG